MKHKLHWYEFYISECPICGHTEEYRERRYTPKPKDIRKRVHWSEDTYCASNDVAWGI